MKGLVVWAQSACRSQMALYRALGKAFGVEVVVPVWFYKKTKDYVDNRNEVGFSDCEYEDMTIIPVGEDFDKGIEVLNSYPGWSHLFCNYQGSKVFRKLQMVAASRGEKTAIGSESPCNMFNGIKHFAKEIYFRTILPLKVRKVLKISKFFVNYSGNDDCVAKKIGWSDCKTIPFGYFPPPIPNSNCIARKNNPPFVILSTGVLTWHRGSDILINALKLLKDRGVPYRAIITQKGPLLEELKCIAEENNLPIEFPGFLPMPELIKLYETCSVFVGSGRREPWGMRLNDALNCGAPLVVSRGMGGVKMIDDYGCGLAFNNEDAIDLADKLQTLCFDSEVYDRCANCALLAAKQCSPENKALELKSIIEKRFPEWTM